MKTLIKICSVFLLTLFSSQIFAAIELKTVAEIEIAKTDAEGKKIIKRTPATTVIPGTEVIYTITATNSGDKAAANISVKDPIPKEMIYVDASAFGKNTVITFSIDGGKNYATAKKLTVKDSKGKSRKATANDYTNIRWAFQFVLNPKQSASVSFRARVK